MKKSATERAIDQLDSEIAVLVAAKARLQQQAQKPKPRKASDGTQAAKPRSAPYPPISPTATTGAF